MRIENQLLNRFNSLETQAVDLSERSLSAELDFFFDNVMDTVVEYFSEKELIKI